MIKTGAFQQRIGKLIEDHICSKYDYYPNKRQQKIGYYDAYDNNHIYEIKAIKKQINRATIQLNNHKRLVEQEGKYIFVNYDLINKDKELSIITDIKILHIIEMDSLEVDNLLSKYGISYKRNFKGHIKEYMRLKFDYVLEGE